MTELDPARLTSLDDVLADRLGRDDAFRADWQRLAFARQVAVALIRYRSEHQLSQSGLATQLGISQPRVAALESGERNPRLETIIEITRRTGIEFAFDSAAGRPKLLSPDARSKASEEHGGVIVSVASA